MSELQFCRTFLSALDARPIKLSSDHIADPRQYPASSAYILPKLPSPPHPARPNPKTTTTDSTSSASDGTISITLKPMKSTTATVPLSSIDASKTSIFDLKTSYSTATSIPTGKIKLLYKKKPAVDSKTVAEVIGQDAGQEVEFTVMVMGAALGGAPVQSPPASVPSEAEKGLASETGGPAAQGPSGKDVVATAEFWNDLKGFVTQRIRDEKEGERLASVFKSAWEKDR